MYSIFHSNIHDDTESSDSNSDSELEKKEDEKVEYEHKENAHHSVKPENTEILRLYNTSEKLTEKITESFVYKEIKNDNLPKDVEPKSKFRTGRFEPYRTVREKKIINSSNQSIPNCLNLNILSCRERIDCMTNDCTSKILIEREKILALKNKTSKCDIYEKRFKNLCYQQKEFDDFVGSIKAEFLSKQAVVDYSSADSVLQSVQKECDLFKQFFPAYGYRGKVLNMIEKHQVSIISADSAYFFNIFLPLLLNHVYSRHSVFACESNEILSLILRDKIDHILSKETTDEQNLSGRQIIVFSEKQLLDHLCFSSFFCDDSFCVIVNLSLKTSVITDILLANILDSLVTSKNSKLILLLSHYDSVSKYEKYFSENVTVSVLELPSLILPVKTMWKTVNSEIQLSSANNDFIDNVIQTVLAIHTLCDPGDIITFLPSSEDVTSVFAALDMKLDYYQFDNLKVFSFGEDTGTNDLLKAIFVHSPVRKVFLVPSGYEGLIIPSVLYVIDSGIKKEPSFDSEADRNVCVPSFISYARAKVRKELAGIYNIGMCIRMYTKVNCMKDMYPKEHAEIFCINPVHSMIKILQYRPNTMEAVQFVDCLPRDIQINTLKLLKNSGAIDKNSLLTPFGEKLVKLPFSSKFSRLILSGLLEWGFAYEAIILVSFCLEKKTIKDVFRESNNHGCQKLIEAARLEFNQLDSDMLTFLNIFKTWKDNGFKKLWCEKNYINFNTLKCIRSKANDLRYVVNECLGENIEEKISDVKDQQDIIQMLFECFQDNLCVYTGHHRTGYEILSSGELALVDSSSILFRKQNLPQFVIYDELLYTDGYFLLNVTPIPFDFIANKLQNGSISFSTSDLLDEKLIKRTIEPVGEKVITQVLLKNEGRKVTEIEERIKKESGAKIVLIEPILGKGCVTIYAFKPYISACFHILDKILKESAKSIMNEEEKRIVPLRKGNNSIAVEILWSKGANTQSTKHLMSNNELLSTFSFPSDAEVELESANTSSINYTLKLFMPRRICTGEGYINFSNRKDFDRYRRLALQYISVDKTEAQVFIEVSNVKENQLHILDIPPEVSKEDLIECFSKIFHNCKFEIELCYLPPFDTSDKELLQLKRQIEENCKNYTNLVNFEIKISKPEPSSNYTYAFINVFEERCLDKEARNLTARKINKMNISCKPLYFSSVKCNADIYEALQYRIKDELEVFKQEYLNEDEEKYFKVEPKLCKDVVTIHLSSNEVEVMKALQMKFNFLLDGVKLSKSNFKQINKLFCHGGHVFLKTLEQTFNICIVKNFETKTIRLFGSQENCNSAVQGIFDFIEDTQNEIVKSVTLSHEKSNRLLLKEIIMKYGAKLEKFIELHGLRTAALNIRTSCLLLYGKEENINKAEESLNELSSNIDSPSISSNTTSEETCPVCLLPAANLTYRLELCGHLYCSECIRGLIEQYNFPMQCCAENCSKDIILADIKYILEDNAEKIQELADKSLRSFLETNQDTLFYCPAADCSMFIYKNELNGDKWKCPLCQNFICIKCNVIFHEGYSCNMYQGSKLDPDYSFKVWQRTTTQCKRCPKCNTAIEKRDGCNHMTCSSCHAHFCWICVTAFSTGQEVYAHINQTHTGLLFAE